MSDYKLEQVDGEFYVTGLPIGQNADTLLLVFYPEGDCDTVGEVGETMLAALYDTFQTSDALKSGDTFSIEGVIKYRCEGVDVIEA